MNPDCETQQAIADEIGVTQPTVRDWIIDFGKLSKFYNTPASLQHFDVWNFHVADNNAGNNTSLLHYE